jgi:hypothetical protein
MSDQQLGTDNMDPKLLNYVGGTKKAMEQLQDVSKFTGGSADLSHAKDTPGHSNPDHMKKDGTPDKRFKENQ